MANNNNNKTAAAEELQIETVPYEDLSSEMELVCPLKYGLMVNGTEYKAITFRRPKAKDIKSVEASKLSPEKKVLAYMCKLATEPKFSVIDELDDLYAADLSQVTQKLFDSDFFGQRAKKASME